MDQTRLFISLVRSNIKANSGYLGDIQILTRLILFEKNSHHFKRIQMSKILNCEVTRIGDMPVSISVGACDEFKLEKPEILICSWNAADQGCHT